MIYRPDKVEFYRHAPDVVLGELLKNRDELAERMVRAEQRLAQMIDEFMPEHNRLVQEVASIRGELELANVQRTLLSGALQENAALEQQLTQARALLGKLSRTWWVRDLGQGDLVRCLDCSAEAVIPEFTAHIGHLHGWIEKQLFPHEDYCFVVEVRAFLSQQEGATNAQH